MAKTNNKTDNKNETAGREVIFKTVVKTSSNINFESKTITNKEFAKDDKVFDDQAIIVEIEKTESGEFLTVSFEFSKEISNIDKVKTVNGYGFKEV